MMAQMIRQQFMDAATSDTRLKTLLKKTAKERAAIDIPAYEREIRKLHRRKFTRAAPMSDNANIIKALEDNSRIRSRLVEIRADAMSRGRQMQSYVDVMTPYLAHTYARELAAQFSTERGRDLGVKASLEPARLFVADMNRLEELCGGFIDDIDKSGWAIKTLVDVLDMNVRLER